MISPRFLSLSDSNGLLNPYAVAAHIGLDLNGLATLVRMHRNSLYRMPHAPGVQARMSEIVRILICADALMAGDVPADRAVFWFRNQPIPSFGNKTAMQLVGEGKAEAVMAHLSLVEDGGYA